MEFAFSKAEDTLRWAVKDFTDRMLMPIAKELAVMDHMPKEILGEIGKLGFMGPKIPKEYGGQPATWVMLGIIAEETAKAAPSVAGLFVIPYGVGYMLSEYGTREAKEEWLPSLIKGEKWACLSLTEPDCGSDAAAITTRAVRDNNSYVINGEKTSISLGMQANVTLLFAKTNPEAGAKGVTAFLVPLDFPGISRSLFKDMGWHPTGRASLTFNEVRIPAKYRVGEEGQGFYIAMQVFDTLGRALSGLIPIGLAQTALNLAIEHSRRRTAFGQPIAKFEGVSFMIAEAATLIEASRWLCYRTLWLKDKGLPNTKEGAMCKWWDPKVAMQVIHDAIIIHGHMGYSEDLPLQQMLRDALAFEIADGTEHIMKLIVAREVIGKVALPYR